MTRSMRAGPTVIGLLAALAAVPPAHAQYYGLYLACEGTIVAGGNSRPADLTLAMRDNNETALIQSSNVLPVGHTVKYKASQQAYTVNNLLPGPRTRYWYDWYNGWVVAWYPNFKHLSRVELTIDRQTGKLAAKLANVKGESLGQLSMVCDGKTEDQLPKPKF